MIHHRKKERNPLQKGEAEDIIDHWPLWGVTVLRYTIYNTLLSIIHHPPPPSVRMLYHPPPTRIYGTIRISAAAIPSIMAMMSMTHYTVTPQPNYVPPEPWQ